MSNQDWEQVGPERYFVIGRGRDGQPAATDFDLVTLILARSRPEPAMPPEHAAILRICGSPLSVAEISAYLRLPNSLVIDLLTELFGARRIEARAPIPPADLPDLSLLEAVIHGLQRL
ncbi:DUF742 domain-containing protein [Kitasatospora sp. NPDC004615]|uniref:DUF742 domain-containing protein n=1 Tax=unclassified Kitasatospora TaxID=2633591 RepID=UPI0036A2006C